MLRLILVLLGALVPAGLGAIFVWSTMNMTFRGDADPGRILLGVAVLAGILGLLYGAYRYVNGLEDMQ